MSEGEAYRIGAANDLGLGFAVVPQHLQVLSVAHAHDKEHVDRVLGNGPERVEVQAATEQATKQERAGRLATSPTLMRYWGGRRRVGTSNASRKQTFSAQTCTR